MSQLLTDEVSCLARFFNVMINEYCANAYCCEDPSLIENYDKAIADTTQTWECHHRGEVLPCGRFSADDLNKFGLYFNRPAAELIFLTPAAHRQLHKNGVPLSEATKNAISETKKGVPLSEAHKNAISEAHKGVNVKKVMQFTKSGEFIREWPSLREAELELGIASSNICYCCNGMRKSAGGYIWQYSTL